MVVPKYARPRHRHRGTSVAFEGKMYAGQTEIEKGQAPDAVEDQRKSKEVVGRRVPRSGQVPPMGGQHSPNAEERWQSTNVCRLSGFEQSESQG